MSFFTMKTFLSITEVRGTFFLFLRFAVTKFKRPIFLIDWCAHKFEICWGRGWALNLSTKDWNTLKNPSEAWKKCFIRSFFLWKLMPKVNRFSRPSSPRVYHSLIYYVPSFPALAIRIEIFPTKSMCFFFNSWYSYW